MPSTTKTAQSSGFVFQTTGKLFKSWGWLAVYAGQEDASRKNLSGYLKSKTAKPLCPNKLDV
ncbi:hypothetical protein, partial [Kingella kingae]|uniref:hypothetical protein n=1 Tax=Kingella kingae TaxID=504 RepID=UPI001FCAD528